MALGIYDAAVPVGAALGLYTWWFDWSMYAKSIYVSHILQDMGWKYAFVVTAMPGVLVLLVGFIRFPKPGESDSRDGDPVKLTAPPK